MKFEYIDEPVSNLEYLDEEKPSNAARIGKEMADYGKKVGSSVVGGLEAGASMVAGIPSQIAGGLYGLGTLMSGQGLDAAANASRRVQEQNFGFGAYVPATEKGKKGAENIAALMHYPVEKAGDVGGFIGRQLGNEALGRLSGELPTEVLMNFLPVHAIGKGFEGSAKAIANKIGKAGDVEVAKQPEVKPAIEATPKFEYLDEAAQMELPLENTPQQIAEMQARATGQRDMFAPVNEPGLTANTPARTPSMAELEAQRRAGLTNELAQTELFDQPEMGRVANPYEAKLGDWRIDENGIPVKVDLSMEAANLENPLQRNLWGDELEQTMNPVGQNANLFDVNGLQEGIPLTEAIDSMGWAQRRGAIKRELTGSVEPSGELLGAMARANRQQGALNFKEISDAVAKLTKPLDKYVNDLSKIDISKVVPKDSQDYASKIPGMGKLLDGVIPRPKLDIDAALASSKDIPALKSDVQSGPEMVGEKYRNPIVAGVSKYLQWADKKYDFANRTMVKPVERTIANLTPKVMIDLAEGLKSEMFARTQNADLFTGKAKEAYESLRREFDNVYNMQAAILQKQGRKIPTKQEAYLASLRNGNYHVNVKDSKGNTAWHIQTTSKWEANQAINWLKSNVDGINKDMVVEYRNPNSLPNVPKDILGGFQELMNLIDESSDASLAIKQAIKDATEQAGYKSLGQNQRFLEKANIRGFEGDMPWLSPEANAKRLLQSQIDYINNAYKWSYLNDALTDVKEVLSNERVLAEQPNAAEYVKDVVKAQLGLSEHLARNAEEYVMSSMGLSRSQLSTAAGKLGKLTSLVQLGASTGYMIATPLTALYSVAQHTREGTLGGKALLNSLTDTSAGIVNLMMDENASKARLPMTEVGKEALKYAADNGIVTKNMFGDLDAINRDRAVSRGLQAYETTITFPERLQRLSTFMSFVHGLKEKGGYSNMYDLFQRAETLTNIAATNFRASEQPIIINKAGTIGGAAFKYKAPILNYYNQLHMTAMDAGKGNVKPLAALLGMTAVLGGIQNLPGINELDGTWNLVKDAVAKLSPENYKFVKDIDVKDFIRQNAPEVAANGVVQEALGAQMSQRFGTDMLNIEDPLKNMFPAAGMAENLAGAAGSLLKGSTAQAAWNVMPQIARGNMETRMQDFKGLQPGSYRKPSDISNTDIQQIRTPEDEAYRKWGLRSAEEAKRLETSAMVNKEQMRIKTALDKSMNSLVKNLIDGDQKAVEKYANTWLELNPDSNAFQSAITEKINRAALSPEQRELANARSIMAIQKIQRLRNARQ